MSLSIDKLYQQLLKNAPYSDEQIEMARQFYDKKLSEEEKIELIEFASQQYSTEAQSNSDDKELNGQNELIKKDNLLKLTQLISDHSLRGRIRSLKNE